MNLFLIFKKFKNNYYKKPNLYVIIFIILIFFFDRYTKSIIIKDFSNNIFFVNDYINFDLIWNTGIGFGLLSYNSSLIYNLITFLISIIILFLIFFALASKKNDKFIFSAIIGGALGNLYDRIVYSAVPDFIDLHYSNFHWFTFNVADMFITIGIITYLINGIIEN